MISVNFIIVFLTFQVTYAVGRHSNCLLDNICLFNELRVFHQ